jgi:hypothetical protein
MVLPREAAPGGLDRIGAGSLPDAEDIVRVALRHAISVPSADAGPNRRVSGRA